MAQRRKRWSGEYIIVWSHNTWVLPLLPLRQAARGTRRVASASSGRECKIECGRRGVERQGSGVPEDAHLAQAELAPAAPELLERRVLPRPGHWYSGYSRQMARAEDYGRLLDESTYDGSRVR